MIKECNVILHNEKVAVIVFEGKKIQVPNSDLIGKTAYIKFENGKYTVVSKEEFEKLENNKNKPYKKLETVKIKNEIEDIVIDNEENIE